MYLAAAQWERRTPSGAPRALVMLALLAVAACGRRNIPVVLANARLSARSARRYEWIRGLIAPTLNGFAAIAAQTEADRERFVALGALVPVEVTGSIKFDVHMPATAA